MQRAQRPQDTGCGDVCWIAIVDRAPSLRLPWLQDAVRSLRPCHQAHLERSSGGSRGRLRNRRWQAFARKDAVYADTGRTFDQLTGQEGDTGYAISFIPAASSSESINRLALQQFAGIWHPSFPLK